MTAQGIDQEYELAILHEHADSNIERTLIIQAWDDLELFHLLCKLKEEDFRDDVARRGFLALRQVFREGGAVSMLGVQYLLEASEAQRDVDAAQRLRDLWVSEGQHLVTAREFQVLVRQVSKASLQRRLTLAGQKITRLAQRDNLSGNQLVELAANLVTEASAGYTEKRLALSERECFELLADQMAAREQAGPEAKPRRIKFGFRKLDLLFPGIAPGQMVGLLARSGLGKSIFGLQCARNVARAGNKVLWFSFEMKWPELMARVVAQELGCPWEKVPSSKLYATGADRAVDIHFDDQGYNSVHAVRRAVRLFKLNNPDLAMVGIDYGQQLAKRTHDMQAEASAALKQMAFDEGIGLLVLLQADPAIDKLKPELRRPCATDVRYSKAWEQDVDVMLSLYRDSYYKDLKPKDTMAAEVLVTKQRDGGPCGVAELRFNGPLTMFTDPVFNPGMTPDMIEEMNRTNAMVHATDVPPDIF